MKIGKGAEWIASIVNSIPAVIVLMAMSVSCNKAAAVMETPHIERDSTITGYFMYYDSSFVKTFDFLEYERCFELGVVNGGNSISINIPEECNRWIKSMVRNQGDGEHFLCFLISDNIGNCKRAAHISITHEPHGNTLSIVISQLGSGMDGSLRKSLTAFYRSLNGDEWCERENWCSDKPLTDWYGLRAANYRSKEGFGEYGDVYYGTEDRWIMEMYANNMRGEIPEEFWKASRNFERIQISHEYLPTSSVPHYVWHKGLKSLDLSYSFMEISLSNAMKNAVNLEEINLEKCKVEGPLPSFLTQMTTLQSINLNDCGISGEFPPDIGNMEKLRYLSMSGNENLTGTLPDSFYNLSQMEYFDIGRTRIGGIIKSDIEKMHKLKSFHIFACEFEGAIPETFGDLYNIKGWDFDANYFTYIPQFVRYRTFNCRNAGQTREWGKWTDPNSGFPENVDFRQRDKKTGRPANLFVPSASVVPDIAVDGKPLIISSQHLNEDACKMLPMPVWANVKYGIFAWDHCYDGCFKCPVWPFADDLQYSAMEYYFDGNEWRHPKLEYPAREYYFNGTSWVHDKSCPWENEYAGNSD